MKYLRQQKKMRRLEERRFKELRKLVELYKLAEQVAREEQEDPRDVLYDLTGEWEPVRTHEWDEF